MECEIVVHPRSSKARVAYVAEVMHVWVTAPPVDGAANDAMRAVLAKALGVPRGHVTLVRGASARHKRIAIAGLSLDEVRARVGDAPTD